MALCDTVRLYISREPAPDDVEYNATVMTKDSNANLDLVDRVHSSFLPPLLPSHSLGLVCRIYWQEVC